MAISITDKRRVAIAYDGSEDARKLFDWAVQNIVNPTTDHLILLSAVQRNDKTASSLFGKSPTGTKQQQKDLPMLSTTVTQVNEALVEADAHPQGQTARQILEDMVAQLKDLNISSEQHILWGDAKVLLPRYTEMHKVNLLIVGSRGLGAIKSVFLGSVSDACLKSCPCPVLVVRNTTI